MSYFPNPGTVSTSAIGITLNGQGGIIATGSYGYVTAKQAGTITGWQLLGDAAGSINITVKKCTYTDFPTTTSIVASAPPTLSTAQKNEDSTLTGWTTAVAAGDIFEFVVNSASGLTSATLQLNIDVA